MNRMKFFTALTIEPLSFNNRFLPSSKNRCVCIHRKVNFPQTEVHLRWCGNVSFLVFVCGNIYSVKSVLKFPTIDPCGTPAKMKFQLEDAPGRKELCLLIER